MKAVFVALLFSLSACTSLAPIASTNANQQTANTRVSLGLKYFQLGEIDLARKNLLDAQRLAPNLLSVNYSLAYFYWKSEQYSHAKNYFLRARAIDSGNVMVLNGYAAFLCDRGLEEQSIAMFMEALASNKGLHDVNLYLNMGRCLKHFGRLSDAIIALEQAINSSPKNYTLYLDLAEIHLELKQANEAELILSRYYDSGASEEKALQLSLQLAKITNDRQGQLFYQSLISN